jgi:signal transduction histidine kinase
MKPNGSRRTRRVLVDLALVAVAIAHGYVALHLFDRDSAVTLSLGLVGAFGIFLRHRMPWVALLIAMPGLFIADAVVAPLVALYTLAAAGTGTRALIVTAAVVVFGYSAIWRGYSSTDLAIIISTYGLVGAVGAVATGMLVRTRRKLSDSIEQLRVIRMEEIERVAGDVRAAERAQLAREMHDAVSHQVSLIAVQAGALQVTSRDEESARVAKVIRSLAVRTIEELRQMVTVLRASGARSEELSPQFTLDDIQEMVAGSGMEVDLKIDVPDDVPPPVERAVYRAVQEGLANAGRYAPGAPVTVACSAASNSLVLTVENGPPPDGLGKNDVPSTKHGHIGLAERAELLGGTFEARETDAGGFVITMVAPLGAKRSEQPRG